MRAETSVHLENDQFKIEEVGYVASVIECILLTAKVKFKLLNGSLKNKRLIKK